MIQNVANWGGALRLNNFADFPTKSIVLRNITLTRNVAAYGGAVSLTSLESVVIVENVLMLNNSATISGGAVMTDGSVMKLYRTVPGRFAQRKSAFVANFTCALFVVHPALRAICGLFPSCRTSTF
jgi:hypothetical protein